MKKLALLVAVALAFTLSALAQGTTAKSGTSTTGTETKTTKTTTKSTSKAGAAKANTITGCLAKSDGGYKIANGNYKGGLAVTTDKDLAAHVGHKVQLTGTLNKEGGKATSFTATDMKHIAATCTVPGGKGTKSAAKGAKAEETAAPKPAPKSTPK